jgi:cell wall assembly regulator SMI1
MRDPVKSEPVIAEFEARYDCRLPEDYRQFLLAYDGAATDRKYCPASGKWSDATGPHELIMFDGTFCGIETDHLHAFIKTNDEWQATVEGGRDYAVTCVGGCTVFLIGIRGADYGKIFYRTSSGIYGLEAVDSFTAFRSLLRTHENAGAAKWNEKVMAEFEARYDCRLPEDYRQFLLTYDGSPTDRNYCPADGKWVDTTVEVERLKFEGCEDVVLYANQEWMMFEKFLGVGTESGFSFVAENDDWRANFVEDSWCPEGRDYVLICGENGCTAAFAIGIRGPVYGKVYYWTMVDGFYEWEGIESFTTFLSLLRTEDETRPVEPVE